MAYNVMWDSRAIREVEDVLSYLEFGLGARQGAVKLADRLSRVEKILETLPDSYPFAGKLYLRRRGYRKATIGKYLLIYRVAEQFFSVQGTQIERGIGSKNIEGIVRIAHLRHVSEEWEEDV